jgi:hypothetical protein
MNRIALVFIALTAMIFMVAADPLYKWVDEQGNVHYSDKSQPGAKQIKLPPATTFKMPEPVTAPTNDSDRPQQTDEDRAPERAPYTAFEIAAPAPDQVYWNVTSVTVSLKISPMLHPGDRVTITLDGHVEGPMSQASFTFEDLDRGAHTVSANLQGQDGSVMIAKSVTFYIQRGTKH